MNDTGTKIRALREKLNMSQIRFGAKIGVSGKAVSAYEQGRNLPSLKVLEKIARTYNISVTEINALAKKDMRSKIENLKESIKALEGLLESV